MEGELIIITVISTLGGLTGLIIINHNWFKRQEIKFRYDLKRAKLKSHGIQVQKPMPEGSIKKDLVSSLIPSIIDKLEPEQLGELIDRFLPGASSDEVGSELGDLVSKIPPELIQGFLDGLKKKPDNEEQKGPVTY